MLRSVQAYATGISTVKIMAHDFLLKRINTSAAQFAVPWHFAEWPHIQ